MFWVIMDRLTKTTHFLPIKDTIPTNQLGKLYVKEIVRLYEVPKMIVLDKDMRLC